MTSQHAVVPPHAGAAGQGVLLIVEDDPDHAFLVGRRLREHVLHDLDVVQMGTAAEATRRLAQGDVRCVVLDLSLPDAKGLEAVAAVRAADPAVPIVVLTGLDSDELGKQALRLGAQDYLVKGQHGADAVGRSVVFAIERTKRQAAERSQALLAGRLQLVLEASDEGICMLDVTGALSFVNRAAAELLGEAPEDLAGRPLHAFHICVESPCPLVAQLQEGQRLHAGEQLFRSSQGRSFVLDVRVRPLHDVGVPEGSVVNLTDNTARRAAQDALAEREAQLVDAQRLAHLGSWEWDLDTDEVLWSDELHSVTGLPRGTVPADSRAFSAYADLVPEVERSELGLLFNGWSRERPPVVVVHRLVRPDGTARWLQCRASVNEQVVPGQAVPPLRVVGTVQDITEQKVAEDALAHQALHDTLTGLPNRALLSDRLDRALRGSRRAAVAVVFMDLDRFKWVNDSMSHAAGDQLLVAVAQRLSDVLRPTDTLARLGGDEFVLVVEQVHTEEQVFAFVDRVSRELERPFLIDDKELLVTASMGVALAPAGERVDAEALIRDADTAMYRAKEKGRARCEIFDEAMRLRASQRLEVQKDLRGALANGEITAWYQPVVDLSTGRVVGCEALARWQHPQRGLLLPDAFIPLAEETGAIVALGALVLDEACRQVSLWNAQRPASEALTVSVNVSGRQLGSADLVERVEHALVTSGLDPARLCLEVTESVVMEDVAVSGAVLGELRRLGVRTAIDDFGTGYSSLAYLLSLPVDVLKVDRSFVRVLEQGDGPAVAIVRAVVALADALGLGVLAEGVEADHQLSRLRDLGVQHGQGFLWGEAVPAHRASWASMALVGGGTAEHRLSTVAVPDARMSLDLPADVRS